MAAEEKDEPCFEEALARLENIVRELEAGKIKLDDAVCAYEEAVRLRNICEKKLAAAKLKIEKTEIAADGSITLVPLDNNHE